MNFNSDSSRRLFLQQTGIAIGGTLLTLQSPLVAAAYDVAQEKSAAAASFESLNTAQAACLAAVADQIYPVTDTPGASALGAVHFMDVALGSFMSGTLAGVESGLEDLDQRALALDGTNFVELNFDAQTQVLRQIESTAFFRAVHFMTLGGCFAPPTYGGNLDRQGWAQLGFESRHAWQPPFGYYDGQGEADS